jgi:hypothetical protein
MNHKLKVILLTPFWLLSTSPSRKTWAEFKSGLIDHVCSYDYSKPSFEGGKHYRCNHLGCNIVSVQNEDGTWC